MEYHVELKGRTDPLSEGDDTYYTDFYGAIEQSATGELSISSSNMDRLLEDVIEDFVEILEGGLRRAFTCGRVQISEVTPVPDFNPADLFDAVDEDQLWKVPTRWTASMKVNVTDPVFAPLIKLLISHFAVVEEENTTTSMTLTGFDPVVSFSAKAGEPAVDSAEDCMYGRIR